MYHGWAAIAVIEYQSSILLTQRASTLASHRGEVAFPGGKWEEGDSSLEATALRETFEEVGVDASGLAFQRKLNITKTRKGVPVQPFAYTALGALEVTLDPVEVEAAFWLPISVLEADQRVRTDVFDWNGRQYWSPAYRYQGFNIWGVTARVLVNYLQATRQVILPQAHSAPVVRHK